jgi:hypothetical protein
MGFYVETGQAKGKAKYLVDNYGAQLLEESPVSLLDLEVDQGLVCVIDNGIFEVAAHCYSDYELNEFRFDGAMRPRLWLTMDKDILEKLSGYSAFTGGE